ncbi:uncharacterized protein LACBIDRAFT_327801 [Laccaria bicolor S238N-H82]|uniref:Predicted protein n=1 Tax=Laccaria bicolor (strain S238N-H82 / ATCC MYA-4686) TaxID=486041 RepID=B0DCV8_LACBS|nr:uncharacterized protein LACBIDRAFT_327801 [Laccaria bicolor S238N-H82]EDR07507.1 predicted protein [Laccaria bicolor S238N-H82]|eukprot:XP_001881899.1 predicted protein [Laccaria bicolor S238N-H82]
MHVSNYSRKVQDYSSISALCASPLLNPLSSVLTFHSDDRIPDYWIDHGIFTAGNNNFNRRRHLQPGDLNPEESPATQRTPFLTDGSHMGDGGRALETAGETALIPQRLLQGLLPPICCTHVHVSRASDYLSGDSFEIVAPSDPLPLTERVEGYDDTWSELDAFILALPNPRMMRSDANFNEQVLETMAENVELTLSTNVTNPLPNSQGRDNVMESTGTANFSVNDYLQGTPIYLDQLIAMDGVTTPVAHFPMAGWHQGIYGQQAFTAPATMSLHSNAQMGGGYSPYNPVAQATIAPNSQSYTGAWMPVYGTKQPLTQAPFKGAFPVDEQQSRKSPATMSTQAPHREKQHNLGGPLSASHRTLISGESEFYCQWGDCSEGPMAETKIFEHFRGHGEKVKENGRVKECKWAGCDPKPGAFPMTSDGFRRHVNETQSHAGIGGLTKVTCEMCGMKRSKRSMPNHKKMCSGASKEPEGKGKKRQD